MKYKLFSRRNIFISVIAVIIAFLLWQMAIIEIASITYFNGLRTENSIALSFDDGPDWGEEDLIFALNETGIHATFFWIQEKIELLQAEDPERFESLLGLLEEGEHEVGIHGYYCRGSRNPIDRFFILGEEEDLTTLGQAYYSLLGREAELFRSHGPRAGRQFYESLKRSDLKLVFGTPEYQISVEAPMETFSEYLRVAEPGSIICAHDSRNCDPDYGLAARIAEIVPELKEIINERNTEIVTVSDLVD
jgi:peptidoglycan/xylan/chitin deacetylase (PgdA/CDA1 family)